MAKHLIEDDEEDWLMIVCSYVYKLKVKHHVIHYGLIWEIDYNLNYI